MNKIIRVFLSFSLAALLLFSGCTSILKSDEDTFAVTYSGNGNTGGTVPTDTKDYAKGDTVTVAAAGTLTRTNGTFTGWNTSADGSGTSYAAGATFAMGSADVTLYAQWNLPAAGTWVFKAASSANYYYYDTGLYADTIIMDFTDTACVLRFYRDTLQVHGDKASYALGSSSITLTVTHSWNDTTKTWVTATGSLPVVYTLGTNTITVTMPNAASTVVTYDKAVFEKLSSLVGTWTTSTRSMTFQTAGTYSYTDTSGPATQSGTWDACSAKGLLRTAATSDSNYTGAIDWGFVNPYVLSSASSLTLTEDGPSTTVYTKS